MILSKLKSDLTHIFEKYVHCREEILRSSKPKNEQACGGFFNGKLFVSKFLVNYKNTEWCEKCYDYVSAYGLKFLVIIKDAINIDDLKFLSSVMNL